MSLICEIMEPSQVSTFRDAGLDIPADTFLEALKRFGLENAGIWREETKEYLSGSMEIAPPEVRAPIDVLLTDANGRTPAGAPYGSRRHVQLMVMADSIAQLFCDNASREEKAAAEGTPRFHPIAEVLSTLYNGHLDITYYCKGGCGLGHFLYELRRNPRFLNGGYDVVEILWYGNELFHVVTLQDGTREKRYRGDSARVENNFRQICFLLKTCCPRPWIYLLGGPEVFMCDMRLEAAIIKYSSLARSFGVGCASGAPYIKQMQERPEK
jgi:hypothetical protein